MRQHPPRTATAGNVENGVDDIPILVGPGPAPTLGRQALTGVVPHPGRLGPSAATGGYEYLLIGSTVRSRWIWC